MHKFILIATLVCFVSACMGAKPKEDKNPTENNKATANNTKAAANNKAANNDTKAAEAPFNGTWQVTSFTCDGKTMPLGDFKLIVDGAKGQFIQGFGPECVATLEEEYAYPDDKTFTIKPKAIACNPNTQCGAVFNGADCPPLPPTTTFGYTLAGDELTFTRKAEGPQDAPCTPGQAVEFKMKKK